MRKETGFTLIEVIIVVAIIAVAAAIGVPSYLSWIPDIRLKSAVANLKSDINLAKQRAIRENGDVSLVFDTVNNQYTIYVGGGVFTSDAWTTDGNEEIMTTVAIPEGVTMYGVTVPVTAPLVSNTGIRFDGRGMPNVTGDAMIRMNNTKNNYRGLTMTLVGSITIERSTDNGGTWQNVD